MLFNSIDFVIFLPIVFLLYWFFTNHNLKLQNALLVVASYVFYGWWDWRFLFLIFFSTVLDYVISQQLDKKINVNHRKALLWSSIVINLGLLGFFKYYNFFLDNFVTAFSFFGQEINVGLLNVILPIGISFYTFQTLSYTIDVYNRKLEPSKDFVTFAAYVCFFPQLVAGPIERATHLLPQFNKKKEFSYKESVDGLRQILWGLFKKIVIADNCAEIANEIFNNSETLGGSTLVLGAVFFSFQIYGDFSGYSDIAIGVSRLFGFDLMQNFAYPYFSRDVAEFWRRWHISLSTWFRDYLYLPLGGSRGGKTQQIRNTFIIFLVSGFWHGANWTFLIWGGINALYFLPLLLTKKNRSNMDVVAKGRVLPSFREVIQLVSTFTLITFAWIFFRAKDVTHAINYFKTIFSKSLFTLPEFNNKFIVPLLLLFLAFEWIGRENKFALEKLYLTKKRIVRWCLYFTLLAFIIAFMGKEQEFIYFQF